ncbi:MAG: class I SAM-dependent methyltransferase [Clostridia bacterium]|nr:class I SAM-dependent methyltransferase [Clostridia bacterium]
MKEKKSNSLFDFIAPIYGLFYNKQKRKYSEIIEKVANDLNVLSFESIVDVGCGTGALCSVLNEKGMKVTGIDPAMKMLNVAMSKTENKNIKFLLGNALEGLPFQDKEFNLSICSYVAHGLEPEERKKLYAEMSRLTKDYVIVYDYNHKKALLTSFIEWLERGDYFHFIKHAEKEMKSCLTEMKTCFSEVSVVQVDVRANWYICKPTIHESLE